MKNTRISTRRKPHLEEQLASIIDINQNYSRLVEELSLLRHGPKQPNIYDVNCAIRDINSNMARQLGIYNKYHSPTLQRILQQEAVGSVDNLISLHEQHNNEVEYLNERISSQKASYNHHQEAAKVEAQLAAAYQQLLAVRNHNVTRQNKIDKMTSQVAKAAKELENMHKLNFTRELQLRNLEQPNH